MHTPVLFMVFNRPDTSKRVFESIKRAKPPRLYLACDGPREGNLEDNEKIHNVKKIIENVNWDCQVNKLYRTKNLGCRLAVVAAINWFFENEEEGFNLEDDTLPSSSLYKLCENMREA